MNKPKLVWTYNYVGHGKAIQIDEEIITTPDKFGRWSITGSLIVKSELLPNYNWVNGFLEIPFCHIQQVGTRGSLIENNEHLPPFGCRFLKIYDANIGLGEFSFRGKTPNEVMVLVQESLDKFVEVILSKIEFPDIYSGDLNTERIKTYKKLEELYNVDPGIIRDIFNAGADWYKQKLNEEFGTK